MLIEKTLREYVSQAAGSDPTPGGGSVSALAGSLGGALTNMVGNLTIGKKIFDEIPDDAKQTMQENAIKLEQLTEDLIKIVDLDATAFDDVMVAFKLPKETDEEKKIRSKAIQEGYKHALEVPLNCAKKCYEILDLQAVFANYGNINAITDVGVGTLLAYSALEGALFNVTINLKSIKDETYKKAKEEEVNKLLNDGKTLKEELLKVVYKRLA